MRHYFGNIDGKIAACNKTLVLSEAAVESKRAHHFVFSSMGHSSSAYSRLGFDNKNSNKTLFVSKILMVYYCLQ
jgi:hypothetical protein